MNEIHRSMVTRRQAQAATGNGKCYRRGMRLALALFMGLGLCAACGRGHPSDDDKAAPSSSVITLGVELGTCEEVDTCARECDAGSADRCRRLAASYEFGKGVAQDEARATALYERACNMSDPSACVFAGRMHEFARGVPKDDAAAAHFYERACDMAWAPGCYNLGILYERGTGVRADRAKAGDLFQIACTAGAKAACAKAAEMHAPPTPPTFLDGGLR